MRALRPMTRLWVSLDKLATRCSPSSLTSLFTDDNSFLPTPIQRYHQLLLPALQLIDSVLSSASVSSTAAAKQVRFEFDSRRSHLIVVQALAFVLAHRETILSILRDHPPRVSLSILSAYQLVVSLCNFVVPQVLASDLASPILLLLAGVELTKYS